MKAGMPVHTVGELRLELQLGGGAGAGLERGRALERHLMSFCARELAAGLDPALDGAAGSGSTVHIRKIELDLGELSLARLETEFAERLRSALNAHLWRLGLPRSAGRSVADPGAAAAQRADALASLGAMLRGHGPGGTGHWNVDALLCDLARGQPKALAALLRHALCDEHARRRLLRGLTPSSLKSLWRRMGAPAAIGRIHASMRAALAHVPADGALLEMQLHEAALAQWTGAQPASSVEAFVHGSVHGLARVWQRSYAEALQALAGGAGSDGVLPETLARLMRRARDDGMAADGAAGESVATDGRAPSRDGPDASRADLLEWLACWRKGEATVLAVPGYEAALAAVSALAVPAAPVSAQRPAAPADAVAGAAGRLRVCSAPPWRAPPARSTNPGRPAWLDRVAQTAAPGIDAERRQLVHWLATGSWPWWADDRCDPGRLLVRQLAHGTRDLAAALVQVPDAPASAQRLARHVRHPSLETLALALQPGLGGLVVTWTKVGAMLATSPSWTFGRRSRSAEAHWRVALGILLAAPAGLSAARFVADASHLCAALLGMPEERYRAALRTAASQAAPQHGRYAVLLDLVGTADAAPAAFPDQDAVPAVAQARARTSAEAIMTRLLCYGAAPTAPELAAVHRAAHALTAAPAPTAPRRRWRRLLADASASPLERARLSRLPPALLERLLPVLLPASQSAEVMALLAALFRTLPPEQRRRADRVIWDTLFDQCHRQRAQRWSSARFLMALAQRLRSQFGWQQASLLHGWSAALSAGGGAHVAQARRSLNIALREAAVAGVAAVPRSAARSRAEPFDSPSSGALLHVGNAGLVLLHPFLDRYFGTLGLAADGDFIDEHARSRAVHLLQFLASGDHAAPEHGLALNKFLCGMPLTASPLFVEAPDERAVALGLDLLGMVCRSWPKLEHTSVAGLRETFLMRAGTLTTQDGKATLNVPKKTVDVLKKGYPWQHAVIKLPWTPTPLFVNWS